MYSMSTGKPEAESVVRVLLVFRMVDFVHDSLPYFQAIFFNQAVRTNSVGETRVRMIRQVAFHLLPVAIISSDTFAMSANWEQSAELSYFREGPLEIGDESILLPLFLFQTAMEQHTLIGVEHRAAQGVGIGEALG